MKKQTIPLTDKSSSERFYQLEYINIMFKTGAVMQNENVVANTNISMQSRNGSNVTPVLAMCWLDMNNNGGEMDRETLSTLVEGLLQ